MDYEFSRPHHIDKIDRKGRIETIEATTEECEALANRFHLVSINSLTATLKLVMTSGSLIYHVTGTLDANITQESVVSGKPFNTDITTDIDAWYIDQTRVTSFDKAKKKREVETQDDEHEIQDEKDAPEPILNGILDIGEVAAQFFGLNLEDFPRLEDETEGTGDYIEVKPEDIKPNPFAKLASLQKKDQ